MLTTFKVQHYSGMAYAEASRSSIKTSKRRITKTMQHNRDRCVKTGNFQLISGYDARQDKLQWKTNRKSFTLY